MNYIRYVYTLPITSYTDLYGSMNNNNKLARTFILIDRRELKKKLFILF